jgi:hypothetical protein
LGIQKIGCLFLKIKFQAGSKKYRKFNFFFGVGYSPNMAKYGYMNAMTSATTTQIY